MTDGSKKKGNVSGILNTEEKSLTSQFTDFRETVLKQLETYSSKFDCLLTAVLSKAQTTDLLVAENIRKSTELKQVKDQL